MSSRRVELVHGGSGSRAARGAPRSPRPPGSSSGPQELEQPEEAVRVVLERRRRQQQHVPAERRRWAPTARQAGVAGLAAAAAAGGAPRRRPAGRCRPPPPARVRRGRATSVSSATTAWRWTSNGLKSAPKSRATSASRVVVEQHEAPGGTSATARPATARSASPGRRSGSARRGPCAPGGSGSGRPRPSCPGRPRPRAASARGRPRSRARPRGAGAGRGGCARPGTSPGPSASRSAGEVQRVQPQSRSPRAGRRRPAASRSHEGALEVERPEVVRARPRGRRPRSDAAVRQVRGDAGLGAARDEAHAPARAAGRPAAARSKSRPAAAAAPGARERDRHRPRVDRDHLAEPELGVVPVRETVAEGPHALGILCSQGVLRASAGDWRC